ncbi:MAG: hypothetical protein QXX20_00985 [Candidatus Thermoplasmatota archaeon]
MLADHFKPKTNAKKKQKAEENEFEENLESMKTWVRKIEQSTQSISSRLAAIERRISGRPADTQSILSNDATQGPIQRIFAELKDVKKKKNPDEIIHVLDMEFSYIQEEIIKHREELDVLKEQLRSITDSLSQIKENLDALQTTHIQLVHDLTKRLEIMERRAPPVMKLGSKEIPIEMTGLIGGILMLAITLIVVAGQKDILISPVFLFSISLILLGSTALKTMKFSNSTIHGFLSSKTKTSAVVAKNNDTYK